MKEQHLPSLITILSNTATQNCRCTGQLPGVKLCKCEEICPLFTSSTEGIFLHFGGTTFGRDSVGPPSAT